MRLIQAFFVVFASLLLGFGVAYAANQRALVTNSDLNLDSQPHWHLGDPGHLNENQKPMPLGPEKALLYVQAVEGVDQIFMTDMTIRQRPLQVQLTHSPGKKSNPVWGPKLNKIRVPTLLKLFEPFFDLPVPADSSIAE